MATHKNVTIYIASTFPILFLTLMMQQREVRYKIQSTSLKKEKKNTDCRYKPVTPCNRTHSHTLVCTKSSLFRPYQH